MSEEEVGEGLGLRARGGRGEVGEVVTSEEAVQGEEEREGEVRRRLRQVLEQDLVACDVQLSLFVAAAASYRQDSALRPFPPAFLTAAGERDVPALQAALAALPSLAAVRAALESAHAGPPPRALRLLLWVLDGALRLHVLPREEAARVVALPGARGKHPMPHLVLEVRGAGAARWEERMAGRPSLWAFHGSRLDNFHSILHTGLQQHRTKVPPECAYRTDLTGWAGAPVRRGHLPGAGPGGVPRLLPQGPGRLVWSWAWPGVCGVELGPGLVWCGAGAWPGVCCVEEPGLMSRVPPGLGRQLPGRRRVRRGARPGGGPPRPGHSSLQHPDHFSHHSDHLLHDHHHQVKLHSADERGEVEGSEGGRVPDMYVVVR